MPAGTGGRGLWTDHTHRPPQSPTDPASGAVASRRRGVEATARGKEKCALGTISTRGVSRVILHMAMVTQLLHNEDSCAVLALKGPAIY